MGIAIKVMPYLNKFFDWIGNNMPLIEKIFNNVFTAIGKSIDFVIPIINTYLVPAIKNIFNWVMDNMPLFQEIWETVFDGIKKAIEIVLHIWNELWWPALKAIFNWINENWPLFEKIFKITFDAIKIAIDIGIDTIKFLWDLLIDIYTYVKGTFQNIGQLFKDAFAGITDFIDGIIEKIDNFIGKVKDAVDAFKSFISGEKDFSNSQRAGNREKTTHERSRPGLAAGGEILTPGEVKVGESGPEILSLPEGARVTPLSKRNDKKTIEQKVEIKNEFNISELVVREETDIEKIARELFNMQKEDERGYAL